MLNNLEGTALIDGSSVGSQRDCRKGANPQRVSTEIIIEIKQFYSGRMA